MSIAKNSIIMGSTFNVPQGDFHNHTYLSTRKGIDLLTDSIAPGAFHNSSERYDPPKCHPSTRVAVLQHIMTWINELQKLCFFMWLYGPAGAGKSAIAQSIAELCHEANLLAASFFFSRTIADRSDELSLIPTLVYQLCLSMPAIRNDVEATIEKDPLVLSRSLEAQIRSLVVDPLHRALLDEKAAKSLRLGPKLIIIDGLDECGTGKVQRYVLSVLATAVQQVSLPISFLVTSRPERIIRDTFHVEPLCSMTRRLALDDSYRPDDDIKLFFRSKFDEIKQNHPLRNLLPPGWPSYSQLVRLVQKSSGQFIYASTVMKYLDSSHQRPTDGLDIIFGLCSPGLDTPFAELDALYIHIFSTVKNINKALELTSLLLLSQTDSMLLTPELLEFLFSLRPGDVYIILSDLHSIMNIPTPATDKTSDVIRIFHASLRDFLLDKSRSEKFYIDAGNAHANLTRYFIKHLSGTDISRSQGHIFNKSLFSYSPRYLVHALFAEAFVLHFLLSSPTPELLDDLSSFDFYRFLTTFHSWFIVRQRISYVFDWLKEHSHKNSSERDLYSHHLLSFDEYLRSELACLTTRSNLGQVMVTAMMLPKFPKYCFPIMHSLAIDLDKDSFNKFTTAFQSFLFLFPWVEEEEQYAAKYHIMLSQFLDDPIRSKEFYIDGDKYATLATAFAKYLFRSSILKVSSDPAPGEDLTSTISREVFLACAFSCLPDCLLKASPSKDLAVFFRNHEIPPDIQHETFDGYSSEATVAAIKAYTLRCGIPGVPDKDLIMYQPDQMDRLEYTAQVDDLAKASQSNPTVEVRNFSIQQSRTKHEDNCGCCHVM